MPTYEATLTYRAVIVAKNKDEAEKDFWNQYHMDSASGDYDREPQLSIRKVK